MPRTRTLIVKSAFSALTLSTALLFGCGREATPDEYLRLAKQAYDKRQTEIAGKNLKFVLEADPDNGAARELLARVYIDEGKGSAAEIAIEKARQLGVESSDLPLLHLQALMLQDKFEKAIAVADEFLAVTKDPREAAQALALRGVAEQGLGKTAEASASFAAALERAPNTAMALVGQAQLALAEGKIDEGRALAERATAADASFAPAWSLLGDIHQFSNDLTHAEEAYTEAINKRSVNSDDLLGRAIVRLARNNREGALADVATMKKRGFANPHAAFAQGLVNLVDGDAAKAAEEFQAVTGKHPNFVKAVCYSGVSQAALGNANRAATELEHCLKKYPDADALRRALAAVLLDLGQPANAERTLQPLVKRSPPDAAAVELLADIKLAQSDTAEAVSLLRDVVTGETRSARDFLNLGRALAATGEFQEANAAFEQAASLDPEIKRTDLIAALSLLRNQRTDEAIARLEKSIEERPDDVQTLNLLAVARLQSGDYTGAQPLLEKALSLQPDYGVAGVNLALLHAKAGRKDAALSLLDELLKREPTNLQALNIATALDVEAANWTRGRQRIAAAEAVDAKSGDLKLLKARFEKASGNPEGAVDQYRGILSEHNRPATAMRELADTLLTMGRSQEGLAVLKELTRRDDRQPRDWLLLARAHEQLHDTRAARRAVDEALNMAPNFPAARLADVRLLLREGNTGTARTNLDALKEAAPSQDIAELNEIDGLVLLAEKKPADAIAKFRRALELEPSSNRLLDLARCIAATGDREGTVATLSDWLVQHPNDAGVAFVLADTYAKSGAADKAVATYRKLLESSPDNPIAMNNLAELLLTSDKAEALALASKAAQRLPKSPGVLDTLGMAQYANGDIDAAATTLRKAVDSAKDNAVIRLHLATVLVRNGSPEEARRVLRDVDQSRLSPAEKKQLTALTTELGQ